MSECECPLEDYLVGPLELVRGDVRIAIEWEGEGEQGEYDPDDPHDVPYLRFHVWRRSGADDGWIDVEGGSWCTQLPATLPVVVVRRALAVMMEAMIPALASEQERHVAEEFAELAPTEEMMRALDAEPARFPVHLEGIRRTRASLAAMALRAVSPAAVRTLGSDAWVTLLTSRSPSLREVASLRLADADPALGLVAAPTAAQVAQAAPAARRR